jgi:hypothetical protein
MRQREVKSAVKSGRSPGSSGRGHDRTVFLGIFISVSCWALLKCDHLTFCRLKLPTQTVMGSESEGKNGDMVRSLDLHIWCLVVP